MRLIDADALEKLHCEDCNADVRQSCKDDPVCASLMWVKEAPTIDPETLRPTGRWIEEEFEAMGVRMIRQKCSECGRYEWQKEKYCHCGCKMEG